MRLGVPHLGRCEQEPRTARHRYPPGVSRQNGQMPLVRSHLPGSGAHPAPPHPARRRRCSGRQRRSPPVRSIVAVTRRCASAHPPPRASRAFPLHRAPGGHMKRFALFATLIAVVLASAPLAAAQPRLTTALGANPPTLDPQKTFNGFSFAITNQVYETLFRVTTDGEIEGLLAAEWDFVEPTRLRVTLREGVAFHDGLPLDAEAVRASLTRLLDPDTGAPGRFVVSAITAVEAVDARTLDIVTDQPFAPLLAHLAHPVAAVVPVSYGDDLARAPVGTGPYRFVSWE